MTQKAKAKHDDARVDDVKAKTKVDEAIKRQRSMTYRHKQKSMTQRQKQRSMRQRQKQKSMT